jgi:hypothetical protein
MRDGTLETRPRARRRAVVNRALAANDGRAAGGPVNRGETICRLRSLCPAVRDAFQGGVRGIRGGALTLQGSTRAGGIVTPGRPVYVRGALRDRT